MRPIQLRKNITTGHSMQLRFDKILSIISDNIGESLQDK